jgi:hypothetical protein
MEQEKKEILLTPQTRISDIQSAFSSFYKYLKIDFYTYAVDGVANSIKPDPAAMLTSFQVLATSVVDVSQNRSIAEVMQSLGKLLSMEIRILRKCGKVWTTISITDNWTLKSQNTAGEFICSVMES